MNKNSQVIKALNIDYNNISEKSDEIDIAICASAGILGAAVEILLVGIPQKTPEGLKGGPLSNYVRDWFNQKFPAEEIEKLWQIRRSAKFHMMPRRTAIQLNM